MQRYFAAWSAAMGRPLLNKNNRNTLCMALLASVLETSVFIVVNREPVYAAQSLLLAREHIQGDAAVGWGLGTHRSSHREGRASPLEDVAEQLRFVYARQREQLDAVPRERVLRVHYEDFCKDPARLLAQVMELLQARAPATGPYELPDQVSPPPLDSANIMKMSKGRFETLKALLQGVS